MSLEFSRDLKIANLFRDTGDWQMKSASDLMTVLIKKSPGAFVRVARGQNDSKTIDVRIDGKRSRLNVVKKSR